MRLAAEERMSRPGRKRKFAQREPNGRIARPTVDQLKELERVSRMGEMATVLAQPHRQGDTHHWRGSALGRFVLAHRLRAELFDVGEEYAALVRRLRAAKGIPVPEKLSSGGMGLGPSDATVRGWERKEEGLRTILMRVGTQAYIGVRKLTVEDRDTKPETAALIIAGLVAIGEELGVKINGHPFA
jgi:hypothetical protein